MQIDHVYTWVNAQDPDAAKLRAEYARTDVTRDHDYCAGPERTRDLGELRASLENAAIFLPFVRKTYIVGSGKPADWLLDLAPHVEYVRQEDILPPEINPCFQSDLIESYIHRIPGLSEHYIYSNDDFFFSRVHDASDFFDDQGRAIVSLAPWMLASGPTPVYRSMEENTVRALRRHCALPPYVRAHPSRTFGLDPRVRFTMARRGLQMLNAISHVSQPFVKSVWNDFHRVFAKEMADLSRFRFRSVEGVAVNVMYHYLARSLGKAVTRLGTDHLLIARASSAEELSGVAREILEDDSRWTRFCLNDCTVEGEDDWVDYVRSVTGALAAKHRPIEVPHRDAA